MPSVTPAAVTMPAAVSTIPTIHLMRRVSSAAIPA